MRSLSRGLALLVATGLLASILAVPALGAETSNSEFVIIPDDDVFPEDLYAGAIRVVVDGTLDGDLVAFAAEEIVINGRVTGSVTAVSPRVTINGEVGESLRVSGNRLRVAGEVGQDLVAAVVDATLTSDSTVGGDVLVWAWRASALGTIGGDLTGTQRTLDIAGEIGGDVDVSITGLDVVAPLTLDGDLGYRSDAPAEGLERASVDGVVVEKTPLPPNLRVRALGLLGRFLAILVLAVAALAIAYGWRARTTTAIGMVGTAPVRRWLAGAAIIFSPLIVSAITGLVLGLAPAAAAFPLLVVLLPVILALIGVVLAASLIAGVPVVGWVGGVLLKRLDLYGSILVGSLIAGIVWYLPWAGWVVPIVVLPLGLGAWIATWGGQSSEWSERTTSSTS